MRTVFLRSGKAFFSLFLFCSVLALAACGPGNTVRLMYSTPAKGVVLPSPGAPTVTVVIFDDQRPQPTVVGVKRDGASISPNAQVVDWVARSLSDELARQGLQVSYATTLSQAKAARPNYIVTGVVREIWLKEVNPTQMDVSVRLTVNVAGQAGNIYSETLSSVQDKQGLLTEATGEKLLSDALKNVLVPASEKIAAKIRSK